MSDMSAPGGYTKLRACLKCKLVKTEDQWIREGCENCDDDDNQEDPDKMQMNTTTVFEGLVSLMNPYESWVAKWNGLDNRVPGCYALDVLRGEESGEEGVDS